VNIESIEQITVEGPNQSTVGGSFEGLLGRGAFTCSQRSSEDSLVSLFQPAGRSRFVALSKTSYAIPQLPRRYACHTRGGAGIRKRGRGGISSEDAAELEESL
jgi:hypothetical protein